MQEKEQTFSPIKQNILHFVDFLGISKREFYAKTGISRGTLESNTGITEDTMAKFIATYPDVSPEWMLTGKGKMTKQANDIPVAVASINQREGVPLIPLDAMADYCRGEMQVMEFECEKYVIPAFREAEFLIPVKGSSMYPKYSSGDIVACKKLPLKDIFFQWNKVYVLDTDQGALIKRVKKGKDDEHILLVSENEKYPPFELNINHIHAFAIVIGVIRLE